jgi:hypothetical protein
MAFAIDHQGLIEANSTTNGGYKLNCLMRETFSKELSAQDITSKSEGCAWHDDARGKHPPEQHLGSNA